ncbi:DUF5309 family protein [Thermoactinomyces sp. DSM 45892]|uniref:SU10 major capsid protein n=1 Tax=Thermoactinomyces sp. DSM 45892 TaxID=1882753 RepID=UPI00089631C6|nr:DUF5309 family protein [Thermoactinomyces sp. DSM 45892]SDZ05083.1 hypothetical protein SAMN05444416_11279 [Thermoactinomyces sp. DSM 45892]
MSFGKVFSTDLIGKRESVVDELLLLNPHQTPMLNLVGFGKPIGNVEHNWFEDELFGDESTVTSAKTAEDTSITVADVEPFRTGHVVKVGQELMLVTAVDVANKAITVVRSYAGTTGIAITDGSKIEVMFVEGDEGRDARQARYKPRKRVSNITQIFDDTVEITGTTLAINQYGIDNLYESEKQKKLLELALHLEKAIINGLKYENGTKRLMRGIRSFVETNIVDGSAVGTGTITYDSVLTESFRKIYESGGMESGGRYVIMVGARQKTGLSNFDRDKIRLTRQENTRGQVVDHWISDFGAAEIVLNNNLAPDELMVLDANRIAIRPLQGREFAHELLGKVGDRLAGMLVGEYTLEFFQEKAHSRIVGLK